jgi:hypothetical protein
MPASRNALVWLVLVSLLLAAVGTVSDVDQIGLWILAFVDSMPSDGWMRAYRLPPPANGEHGFRPLSVLLLKGHIALFGTGIPPLYVIFAKIFASSLLMGWAAWVWLRSRGFIEHALLLSTLCVLAGPHLFGLWMLTELDGIGAAMILLASALVAGTRPQHAIAGILMVGAMFLKESSALMMLAFLAAQMLSAHLSDRPRLARRCLAWLLFLGICWTAAAWELVAGGRTSNVGGAPWSMRLPIILFTAWQLVYLLSVPGTVLLALGALVPSKPTAICMAAAALVLLPPIYWINHYESIYFSPWWYGGLLCLLLYAGLARLAFRVRDEPGAGEAALTVLSSQAVMWLAILASSSPREDMASRLFLPALPPLLAVGGLCASRIWSVHRSSPRYLRWSAGLLIMSAIWFFPASAVNSLVERHARDPLHHKGLHALAEMEPGTGDRMLFNNFSYRLGPESLLALSGRPSPQLAYIPDMLPSAHFPTIDWGERLELERLHSEGEVFWLFWSARRANPLFGSKVQGDFSYTRRPMGAFQPLHRISGDFLPSHNYVEDARLAAFHEGATPLQTLAASRGEVKWSGRNLYFQLLPHLYELPWRLLDGTAPVEIYTYDNTIWKICRDCTQ